MSAYQIPQFLDSGDKIFMGMNVRQFGYFMVGIIGTIIMFNPLYAAIGYFAILPCLPIGLLALYLSIGKYNGRDSEIYILKTIIFFTKPRMMMYSRQPLMDEINAKMALLTVEVKEKELLARVAQNKSDSEDPLANFGLQNAQTKAKIIQGFGRKIDTQGVNISQQIAQQRVKIAGHTQLLNQMNANKPK